MTLRRAGAFRTYRTPARNADAKRSAGSTARLGSRRQRHSTTKTPSTETALMTKTGPGPPATMIRPASAGPIARAMLIATLPSPMAAGNSSRGTVSGMMACHAGRSMALPAPMASVITSSIQGWMTPVIVSTPSKPVVRNHHTCAMSRIRRRSKMSASAPAGSASRNSGSVVAACTSETMSGEGASSVISHAAAESCIQVPMLEATSAIQRARNSGRRRGLHAEAGVGAVTTTNLRAPWRPGTAIIPRSFWSSADLYFPQLAIARNMPERDFSMTDTTERAVLAGGCFWGMQDLLRRYPGVISTRVGYTGGDVPNATYRNHGTHAEAIEIIFDPRQISYRRLLEFFFQIHDPTTKNRQGNDVGASYRSAIFFTNESQKQTASDTIADVDASGLWPGKVVTEVAPAGPFWEAEPEHQDYLERYPDGYTCHFIRPDWVLPKRAISSPA